jgi:hypothetical protein
VSVLRLKILVVDREDSEFLRSSVVIFDEMGFNVDFCSDWDSMLRKLKHSVRATDFLIIDLAHFQDRNSYLLLMELRGKEYTKDLKIILTTETLVEEELLRARGELGIVASFNKTRHVEELLYVITNIIPPGGENLRRSRRIPARFLVHSTLNGKTKVLCARNLSRDGIFVENHTPDPVGTMVELSFALPGRNSSLALRARAARATVGSHVTKQEVFPAGNGFEFVQVSDVDARSLKEYVEHEELRIFGPEERTNTIQELKEQSDAGIIPEAELRQLG